MVWRKMQKRLFSKGAWFFTHPWIASLNIIMGVVLILTGTTVLAVNSTKQAANALMRGDLTAAAQAAQTALPIVKAYNFTTFRTIPDLTVWQSFLELSQKTKDLLDTGETLAANYSTEKKADVQLLLPIISDIQNETQFVAEELESTLFAQDVLPAELINTIHRLPQYLSDVEAGLQAVSQNDQIWIIILQNSDEIRATGGFPGSYALVHVNDGILTDIIIEDIYDADGQFNGYINAPAGIREYTSSNKGLRLPDANWWPDFPVTAQTMLQFFALGDKQKISGLLAINSDVIKSLLEITGPVVLPDYDISLSSQNMHQVLRTERGSFFPGSNQKKNVLNQAMQQFQRQLAAMPIEKKIEALHQLHTSIDQKEIQLYSPQPQLQEMFEKYRLGGVIDEQLFQSDPTLQACSCIPLSLFLVESNVGINKVNPYIDRTVSLQFEPQTALLTTTFTNAAAPLSSTELSNLVASSSAMPAPRNGNGYLNYYRILISPDYSPTTITIQGQPLQQWDDELITTSQGQQLRQIGYLIGVPEQQTVATSIAFSTKQQTPPEAIILYKQTGLPEVAYTISAHGKEQQHLLRKDSVYSLR